MKENNNVNVNNVNLYEQEEALIKTQEELTNLLRAVKNGEQIDEKYKICMKKQTSKPCVDLYRCFRDGFVAKGAIKNVDDIFQYLVFDFGPNQLWSRGNFTDQHKICEVLSLICQPGYNVNRIKNFEHRLVAGVFYVDGIKTTGTKYIFNLKEQMNLGIVNPENYGSEDHIQDFLLPDSIEDIGDLVKFMSYDSENNGNRVLPKIDYWRLIDIPPACARQCLKNHYYDINSSELSRKFNELKRAGSSADEQKKLYSDLRSELEKARDNSGAIKDFDQFKKIVNFPNDQPKLPFAHAIFFANNSVRDGVEFLKLFDDQGKHYILTSNNGFRIFKTGAFHFETRDDIQRFLTEECNFKVYKPSFKNYIIPIICDLLSLILLVIISVVVLVLYVPLKIMGKEICDKKKEICDKKHVCRLLFENTRGLYDEKNKSFNLAIKNIENNCAAGKQHNNLQNDNAFNVENSLENSSYSSYQTFNNPEDKNNNNQPNLPTLEGFENAKQETLQDEIKQ